MEKWEYTTIYIFNHNQLNELGQEGWELCAVDGIGMSIFKRKIQQG